MSVLSARCPVRGRDRRDTFIHCLSCNRGGSRFRRAAAVFIDLRGKNEDSQNSKSVQKDTEQFFHRTKPPFCFPETIPHKCILNNRKVLSSETADQSRFTRIKRCCLLLYCRNSYHRSFCYNCYRIRMIRTWLHNDYMSIFSPRVFSAEWYPLCSRLHISNIICECHGRSHPCLTGRSISPLKKQLTKPLCADILIERSERLSTWRDGRVV